MYVLCRNIDNYPKIIPVAPSYLEHIITNTYPFTVRTHISGHVNQTQLSITNKFD